VNVFPFISWNIRIPNIQYYTRLSIGPRLDQPQYTSSFTIHTTQKLFKLATLQSFRSTVVEHLCKNCKKKVLFTDLAHRFSWCLKQWYTNKPRPVVFFRLW
jgi:hypothetical protein